MKKEYSKGIMNILLLLLFFGAVFLAGSFLRIKTYSGATVPVLNNDYLNESLVLVALIIILTIVRECVKMFADNRFRLILLTTAVVNISSAVLYVIWLNDRQLKNIQFIDEMKHRLMSHNAMLFFIDHVAAIYAFFVVLGLMVDLVCVMANTKKQIRG